MVFMVSIDGSGRSADHIYSWERTGRQGESKLEALVGVAVARGWCWGGWRRGQVFVSSVCLGFQWQWGRRSCAVAFYVTGDGCGRGAAGSVLVLGMFVWVGINRSCLEVDPSQDGDEVGRFGAGFR